jgi:outer membrane protein
MKRLTGMALVVFLLCTGFSYSQLKIGYVDSDTIMDKLPDAQDARQKLDNVIKDWQTELSKLEAEWKSKYDDYDKRKLIMTDQTRAETEQELVKLEQGIAAYREKKFGTNGELFQKQDELMKPVQNKVFLAIQAVAENLGLDFVFDRSGDIMLLYAKTEYDITQKVLDKLKLEQ